MKLVFPFLLLFITASLQAQDRELKQGPQNNTKNNQENDFDLFDKGRSQAGGFLGGGGTSGYWEFFAMGRYGYFLLDRWNTGMDGTLRLASGYNQITIGPYTRYYFLKKQFSPVVEVNYNYLVEQNNVGLSDFTTKGTFAQGLVGVSFLGFLQNFGGELLLNYNLHYDLSQTDNNNGTASKLQDPKTIGFTYRINYFF